MADSPKRVGWDACTWIALIQKEKILDDKGKVIEDRYALARSVIDLGTQGKIEIVASGLCLAEVSKNPSDAKTKDDLVGPFFQQDYILIVPVDMQVGTIARGLMRGGHGLRPPDAVHLATAMVANVDELHTFDDRLLKLDERLVRLDGTALKICKPAHGGPPMPLLDQAEKAPAPKPPEVADAPKPEAPAEANGKPKEQAEAQGAKASPEIPPVGEGGGGARPEGVRGDAGAASPAPAQAAQGTVERVADKPAEPPPTKPQG